MASQPTILVADDQASYRELIARLLRGAGYRVILAPDGRAAVDICRNESPDCALLDLTMPELDGIAATRAIRALEGPYIPLMIVSQRSRPDERVAGLRAGAEDYLGKPFHNEELLARVAVLLRLRHLIGGSDPSAPMEAAPVKELAPGRDPLTGLWTYKLFEERLASEVERATRYNEPLALMVIEVDGLATGTRVADDCVVASAGAVARCTRAADIAARHGDAGFSVIMPKTNFAGSVSAADRMWRELAGTFLPKTAARDGVSLRSSIGVACFPTREASTGAELTRFAQSALDRARTEGPAHICLVQHQAYIFRPE